MKSYFWRKKTVVLGCCQNIFFQILSLLFARTVHMFPSREERLAEEQ